MSSSYESYLRGLHNKEQNLVAKKGGGRVRVALIFPNRYFVAMSNLGFLLVYRMLAEEFGIEVDRAFLPDDEERKNDPQTKLILTIESRKTLREFDALLFSVSFENDYLNILKILYRSGIPPGRGDRDYSHPLVMAGGAAVTINPEPVADFIDAFALGEGEGLVHDIARVLVTSRDEGYSKEDTLDALSRVSGIYVPGHFDAAYDEKRRLKRHVNRLGRNDRVRVRKNLDFSSFSLSSSIVTPQTEFSDMFLVEVERGCPFSCAFCVTPSLYSPVRMRNFDEIIRDIDIGIEKTGKVGLIGPAIVKHPEIDRIFRHIRERDAQLGLPSLRTELISEEGIDILAGLGIKTLTLAPESGSEDVRRALGKNISDDDFMRVAVEAVRRGINNFRLYFLIGILGERDEDVFGIVRFSKRLRHVLLHETGKTGRAGKITVSVNPLVPKPHTPLMWMGMDEQKNLEGKIKYLTRHIREIGNAALIHEPPKWSYIQALLARGDRSVGEILMRALVSGDDWKRAMRETKVNPYYFVLRERETDEVFPWDFIDMGYEKESLLQRYLMIKSKLQK